MNNQHLIVVMKPRAGCPCLLKLSYALKVDFLVVWPLSQESQVTHTQALLSRVSSPHEIFATLNSFSQEHYTSEPIILHLKPLGN